VPEIQPKEKRFGDIAVSLGLISAPQLDECLQIQRRLSEMGVEETLGEILVKKGYLAQDQVGQVLSKMGIDVQVIPQYRLVARLGRGGMGSVYKALHVSMNRVVALKILDREATANQQYVERFLREARQAAQLSHPHIVRAFDAGQANGLYYFAMEHIAGETVHRQVKRGGVYPERKAIDVMRQIADALGYISKRGLVHRDVKPENVLVEKQGHAYLCDFGLAKSMVDGTLTRSGFTFGTPFYMSPEQIEGGKNLDVRSDLYSLGACLFYMLTGRPPFEGGDLQAVLSKHLTEKPPDPRTLNPNISEGVCQIYFKLMEKNRDARYRGARELIADLRRVSAGLAPQAGASRSGVGKAVAACLTIVLLGALALGGYFYSRPKPAPRPPPSASTPTTPGTSTPKATPTPPTPAGPSLEERQKTAREIFAQARQADQDSRWEEAADLYKRLAKDYADVLEDRLTVFEREAYCRMRYLSAADASTADFSEKQRAARELYQKAFGRMRDHEWGEAIVLLQQLLLAEMPEVASNERVQELIEQCTTEQRALADWQKIQEDSAGKGWERVISTVAWFRKTYAKTDTMRTVAAYLESHEKRAQRELEAVAKLRQVLAHFDGRAWAPFRDAAADFTKNYSDTDTGKAAEADLRAKISTSLRAEREPFEKAAQALFEEAGRDLSSKSYAAAKAKYEKLLAEHAGTEFVSQKKPDIDKGLAEIAKAEMSNREKEFQRKYRDLKVLYDKKKYEEAMKALDELLAEYPDAEFWDPKQKELETVVERSEMEIHKQKYGVSQDFEDGPSGWTRAGPANPRISGSDMHVGGKRGARVEFDDNVEPAEWGRVWKRLDLGFSPYVKSISFNAQSADRSVMSLYVFVLTRVNGNEYIYMTERQIGGAWSKIRVSPSEFRPIQGQDNPPKLDAQDIRGFGFAHPGRTMRRAFFLDDIESEFR